MVSDVSAFCCNALISPRAIGWKNEPPRCDDKLLRPHPDCSKEGRKNSAAVPLAAMTNTQGSRWFFLLFPFASPQIATRAMGGHHFLFSEMRVDQGYYFLVFFSRVGRG